jgi:hypothetical protein
MATDDQNGLEQAVDRTLKRLPELSAPETLLLRVMAAIQARESLAWYRQPWQAWPAPLRSLSLTIMLGCFGGLCLAAWQLMQLEGVAALGREVGQLFAGVSAFLNVLGALLHSAVLVAKKLGTGVIVGCLLLVATAYTTCLGLGSVCVRLAMAKR